MKKRIISIFVALLTLLLTFSVAAKTVKLGDVSGDGKITASDARKILRIAATLDACDEETKLIADVDKNGKIVAADARKVLRVAAQIDAEFGDITIGEAETETTTEPVAEITRTELKDCIGMTVTNFMKQYGTMTKDGTDDGSTMYHNDQVTIVSDPKMIDDLKINSITVTGENYTLNGIYAGMDTEEAIKILLSANWKEKSVAANLIVYSKSSDLIKLSIRNGKIRQVELCLSVSIATNVPTETTTQETTTQEITTVPEETTQPDNNYIPVDALPTQVQAFLNAKFGFKGTIYKTGSEPNNVTLYTNGADVAIDLAMELSEGQPVNVRVLIKQNGNKAPQMFMINTDKKTYANFNPAIAGGSIDDFKFDVSVGDISSAKITSENQIIENKEYALFDIATPNGKTRITTLDGNIVRIETFGVNGGEYLSKIEINEFYQDIPEDIFSTSQYTKKLSFLTLFM